MATIVAIPGLGDNIFRGYLKFMLGPIARELQSDLVVLTFGFDDKVDEYEKKIRRIAERIQNIDGDVYLFGSSAGGTVSVVLESILGEKIKKMILFCSPLEKYPFLDNYARRWKMSVFTPLMDTCLDRVKNMDTVSKSKAMTIYPLADWLVPPSISKMPGAVNLQIPSVEHRITGGVGILMSRKRIVGFLKN